MKSSVTSRKQRFWALLLAVVMVVGLLPTAGVKAEETTITTNNWFSDEKITDGTIFKAGDTLKGDFIPEGGDGLQVIYQDVDGSGLHSEYITATYDNGARMLIGEVDNSGNITKSLYAILDYMTATRSNANNNPILINGEHYSDYWMVVRSENPRDLVLKAIPEYTIIWDLDDGEEFVGNPEVPQSFIPGVSKDINLDMDGTPVTDYKLPSTDNLAFNGWQYAKLNPISGRVSYTDCSVINKDNCASYDRYVIPPTGGDAIPAFVIELKGKYINRNFTVNFNKGYQNDAPFAEATGTMESQQIDYLDVEGKTLTEVGFSLPGYNFKQWDYIGPTANYYEAVFSFNDKESLKNVAEKYFEYDQDPNDNEIDLYAYWEKDLDSTYTIKLNPNYPEAEITSAPYPAAPNDITNVKFWELDADTKEYTPASYLLPVEGDLQNDKGDPKHYVLNGWRVANPKEGIEVEDLHTYYGNVSLAKILEEGNVSENNVIEMVADWQSPDYQISFVANNPNSIEIPEGVPTRIPKPPVEDDDPRALNFGDSFTTPDLSGYNSDEYVFAGWVLNPDHAANPAPDELIDKNKEYSISELITMSDAAAAKLDDAANGPQWIKYDEVREYVLTGVWKQKHTVTFDYNYPTAFELGKDTTKSYVIDGEKVAEPSPAPSYEGWIFDGWYYDAEEKIPVAIPVIVERPQNVDGLPNIDNLYAPNPMPNDPGEGDEGDEGDDSWVKYDFDSLVLGDFTLVAKWEEAPSYTVTFNMNGRGEQVPAQTVKHGGNVKCPFVQDVDHYTVKGWYVIIDEEETPWDFYNNTVEDDITLYAEWGPTAYIVDYDYNAPFETPVLENPPCVHDKYSEDVEVPLPVDNVDTDEYKFLGWSVKKSSNTVYTGAPNMKAVIDAFEKDGEFTDDGIAVLYGVWKQKGKKTYTWLDGDGSTLYTEEVDEDAEAPKLPADKTPAKTDKENDYTFAEWEESENDNGIVYTPKFNSTKKKYTVTFVDENGTTVLKAATEYEYGTKAASIVKPANPTKSGYTFNGWTPAIADVTNNATYKATYTKINSNPVNPGGNGGGTVISPEPTKYTITWIDGNGNEIYSDEVAEGSTPVYDKAKHGTPTKNPTGYATYSFNNTWSPAITKVTKDQEYVAQFDMFGPEGGQENPTPTATPSPTVTPTPTSTPTPAAPAEYDIEYYEELPDGTEVQLKKTNNPDKYTYGVGAEIKYGIDKEGYTFEGWYSKRSKKYVKKVGTKTKGTVKLYAIFVPDDSGKGNEGDNGKGLPTDFSTLFVRLIDYTENSMTLKWEKMEYVDGYDILGSRCNSKDVIRPYEPIVSVDADTDEYVMSNLLAKTYYKFYVRAFILVNGEKRYITTSINVHGVTLNDTYGVADELEIEKVVAKYINGKSKTKYVRSTAADDGEINITLKVGQSLKIVTSEYNRDGKEIRAHRPISFESSDPAICKIGKKSSHKYGVVVADKANTYKSHTITALAAGECDIYVFAQNGVYKTIHVTVK